MISHDSSVGWIAHCLSYLWPGFNSQPRQSISKDFFLADHTWASVVENGSISPQWHNLWAARRKAEVQPRTDDGWWRKKQKTDMAAECRSSISELLIDLVSPSSPWIMAHDTLSGRHPMLPFNYTGRSCWRFHTNSSTMSHNCYNMSGLDAASSADSWGEDAYGVLSLYVAAQPHEWPLWQWM